MKKLLSVGIVVLMIIALTSSAFAATPAPAPAPRAANGYGFGCATGALGCYGLMWNEDGSFASKDDFSARLDKAIEDGLLAAEDKAAYLESYDYCVDRMTNGGCGRGYGMGGGCGRMRAA